MNSRPQPYQGCALPLSYGSTDWRTRAYPVRRRHCQPFRRLASNRLARALPREHMAAMAGNEKEREERLAAALRENLRKRKAQARDLEPKPKD